MLNGVEGKPAQSFRVIDLFSGTGAIGFGLRQGDRRFTTVMANDVNDWACETTRLNHPEAEVVCAPVSDVGPLALDRTLAGGAIDLVIGGPPCQGFSSLRPSRGLAIQDPRNSLYREFQRIVAYVNPRAFLLENVIGLVNAAKGGLLQDLIEGFEDAGFACDWRILNSAQYGVPQKRERFFLLGIRWDVLGKREIVMPRPTHSFSGRTIGIKSRARLVVSESEGLPIALSAWDAISDLPGLGAGESADRYSSKPQNQYQKAMRVGSKRLTLHNAARHNEKMLSVMRVAGSSRNELPEGLVSSGYSSCYSRIAPYEPAPTVTVKFTSPASSKCIHPWDLRSITPREAARFQSFPDVFAFAGPKTSVASQIGNAVPPLLGQAFSTVIASYLEDQADGRG